MLVRFEQLLDELHLAELEVKLALQEVQGNLGAVDHRTGSGIRFSVNFVSFFAHCSIDIVVRLQVLVLVDVVGANFDKFFLKPHHVAERLSVNDGLAELIEDFDELLRFLDDDLVSLNNQALHFLIGVKHFGFSIHLGGDGLVKTWPSKSTVMLRQHRAGGKGLWVEQAVVFVAVDRHRVFSAHFVLQRIQLSMQVDREYLAWSGLGGHFRNAFAFAIPSKVRLDQVLPLSDAFLSCDVFLQVEG